MAATIVPLPIPTSNDAASLRVDNPAEARKRRREILSSHRNTAATPDTSASASAILVAATDEVAAPNKKRRVSANADELPVVVSPTTAKKPIVSKASGKAKKPQMKYDPDVPMTKEEAAAWRREQRRKRNRESAAASRQRQRDRIVELEAEVDEWKVKFDEAMKRIQELEQAAVSQPSDNAFVPVPVQEISTSVPEEISPTEEEPQVSMMEEDEEGINIQSPEELVEEVFKDTTILISPSHSPRSVSPTSSTTVDFSQVQAVKVASNVVGSSVSPVEEQEGEEPQPSKMISRQAVKIRSGPTSLPLLPDEETLLTPDPCRSKMAPIDLKLAPRPVEEDAAPVPVTKMLTVAAENEEEFGEFLLDAVDWL